MTVGFAGRYKRLFHVTRRSALPGISRHGLCSASLLATASADARHIEENRDDWTELSVADFRPVWLRWQRMRDHVLRPRLPPETTPTEWRRLINGMVFLFPSEAAAARLREAPADVDVEQLVIAFDTASLIAAGCELLVCRWNNGFPDRRRPPRLRAASDYRPVAEWRPGDAVAEVTVAGSIPRSVAFEVLPDSEAPVRPVRDAVAVSV